MRINVIDGFTVKTEEGGRDYHDIWMRFKRGEIPCEFERAVDRRSVHILNVDGERLVLKTSTETYRHWENRLSRRIHGPVFSKIMRESNRAIDEGCALLPRVHMVAERMKRGLAVESVMILEYKEGTPLAERADWATGYRPQVAKTARELHAHRIAITDPNPGNFILGPDGTLSVIDLSFRDSFRVGRAKDVLYLKRRYGIDLPTPDLLDKCVTALIAANRGLRAFFKNRRKRAK